MELMWSGKNVKFLDLSGIEHNTFVKILNQFNHLGYDLDIDSLYEYLKRGTYLNEDQSDEIRKIFYHEQEQTISEQTIQKYNQKAVEYFGLTENPNLAGYLLTNGNMLKFSYDGYQRNIDHREIKDVLDYVSTEESNSNAMIEFINYGNIRLNERCMELSKPCTEKQLKTIASIIRRIKQSDYPYFQVDISNNNGTVVKSFSYDFPLFTDIVTDINNYFQSITL